MEQPNGSQNQSPPGGAEPSEPAPPPEQQQQQRQEVPPPVSAAAPAVDRSLQHTPPPPSARQQEAPPPPESMFSPKPVPMAGVSATVTAGVGVDGGPSSAAGPSFPSALQEGSSTAANASDGEAAAAALPPIMTSTLLTQQSGAGGAPAATLQQRPRPLPLTMKSSSGSMGAAEKADEAAAATSNMDQPPLAAPPGQPAPATAVNDNNNNNNNALLPPGLPMQQQAASMVRPDGSGTSGGTLMEQQQQQQQQQFETASKDPTTTTSSVASAAASPGIPPHKQPPPPMTNQNLLPGTMFEQQQQQQQKQPPPPPSAARNEFLLQQQPQQQNPSSHFQEPPTIQQQQQQMHLQQRAGGPPQMQQQMPPGFQRLPESAGHAMAPHLQQQQQQQQQPPFQQHPHHPVGGIGMPPQGPPGAMGGMRELRVEDALLYLDDVKREFKDRPAIYNEFLAIMKNFKTQEVDTPGVIERVSKLFRGYNTLILGFNTFLPDGFKIRLEDLERAEARRVAEEQAMAAAAAAQQQGAGKPKAKVGGAKRGPKPKQLQQKPPPVYAGAPASPTQQQQDFWSPAHPQPSGHASPPQQQQQQQQPKGPGQRSGPFQPQQQQQQQQPPHQAVEFDHAISYVTTIKKRFAADPNTYHSFLEILHTYQKEQRGIKEVLEQVAHLFQDHPDLLKEFTFFLPDAVQEQAKERLHRAAAESESRIAAQRQQQQQQQQMDYHQRMGSAGDAQHFIDMTRSQQIAAGQKRGPDGQPVAMPPVMMPQPHPESYVYNSAVERQFFDSAREALSSFSRDGGQAWAEFLKCLDMYAQEILSRSEMLNFVEPLLGKRNNQLFEEFKRILNSAGSPNSTTQMMIEDSWYSVPLAEIDFSRCRRCSPSYRALPRDYPAHPCSGRSEEEAKALNDIWVSLPVGSEESYTFRHMRRNTYEETLFRVEDERFEIDMVIDTNAATLQRLEPIAEEIALLSQEEVIPADLGIKPAVEGAGLGGKRFQYTFDSKSILGVIHRNSISRIYGESGQEMLDLMVKNPSVAIPLVVSRLRQKDAEFRAVRERLNKHWKELAEANYYKSLDHRSLTWRTVDKRAISTRSLIAEIKDRAANGGREGKEAMRQKLDKAKEEHGTFYEVTVGSKLSSAVDLTYLPKPDRRLFTPHLTLTYKNVSWAQRDAYRILAFALERGPISPADKERCHRLWVEFLGPWFDLSLNWMQKPAVTYQESSSGKAIGTGKAAPATIVSEDDEESMDEDPEIVSHMVTEELRSDGKDKEYTDHHPLPAGAHVSTLYGEGKVLEFRRSDHIYVVQLKFGTGYLRPATVLCSMLPVEKSAYTRQLRADDRSKLARPNDQLAFGTQSLYLFFRLHQILVNRLNTAKRLAYAVGDDQSLQSMVEQMPNVNPKAVGRRRYEAYLSLVYALLDGGVGGAAEGGKYEDRVRSLLGHGGYELATMDKLISHIWKDIQAMANDETMWNLVQLYRRHSLAGGFQPEAFRQEAAYLSDGEPMYAFQHCPLSSSDESVLHMEYVGVMDDEDDDEMEEDIEPVIEGNAAKRQKR